ncbi:hypothetical protein LCGC14_1536230 [marine sediment metagenome]|uniref:MotA/TolQ/ExbB proton channel domain-containing protein n=1 Tax=marine sediment metagenome TaxID=412755 RepID=A0A0F9LV90_9ZZZZ
MKFISKIADATHELFLRWVLINVTVAFAVAGAAYHGLLHIIYLNDPSYLTYLITLLYLAVTAYTGVRTYWVSRQQKLLKEFKQKLHEEDIVDITKTDSIIFNHLADLRATGKNDQTVILMCRSNDVHDKHEVIWHYGDVLVNLGLVGTVVGFTMALWPFFILPEFTFEAVKGVLGTISGGIAVALFTTGLGITTSVIIKVQARYLETGTNQLMTQLAYLTETKLIPILRVDEN